MSWYSDAFVSDLSKVKTDNIKAGAGLSSLGDAFSKIGTTMKDDKLQEKKNELIDSQLKTEKLNQEAKTQNIDDAYGATTQKAIDDAYLSNLDDKGKFDDKDGTIGVPVNQVSFAAKNQALAFGKEADEKAQKNFNDVAIKTSSTYDDWDKFKTANPELIENADGSTIQTIKKTFSDNTQQIKDLKYQKTINLLSAKLTKAEISAAKKSTDKKFKYTQETGVKIKNLIKTSLGMDNELTSFDDAKQKEFNSMIVGVSALSKKYNLEPIPAYNLYLDAQKSNPSEEKVEKKSTWKDIDIK